MLKTLKIEDLKGADYNPRTIAEPQLEQLCESIKKLGVIKPVILNGETNVLLAGHQRTRSMKKLGMTETPGFVLMGIKRHDEVRFNQYHNMVEVDVQGKAPEILLTNFEEILRDALKYEFSLPLPNNQAYTLYQDNAEFFDLLMKLNKCTQQSKS